ncbi:MAG: hypothetical protein K8R49_00420 [Candidatus Cloacimonetes bacterium]|nr:hypothetical protein [Candidatus Cloacimonadota bacterium]
MKKLILLLFCVAVSITLTAQVDLTISPERLTYNVFYPANFNPEEPENQPVLFTINFDVTGVLEDYVIHCDMSWRDYSAYATLTPDDPNQLPSFLTNQDIIRDDEANGFQVDESFSEFLENIEDLILDTGRLPDGNYIFVIAVYSAGHGGEDDHLLSNKVTFVLTIQSPITISLITPGNPIGLGPATIADQYPNFVWFSNLADYTIKIYELDGEYQSAEEIEQQIEPFFEENNYSSTSFPYPPTAPDFQKSIVYAWQVSSDLNTPMGSAEKHKSVMYLFMVSTEEQEDQDNQMLINFLRQLNIEGIQELITLIESGYSFDKMFFDGNEISINDLNEILQKISDGEIKLKDFSIE